VLLSAIALGAASTIAGVQRARMLLRAKFGPSVCYTMSTIRYDTQPHQTGIPLAATAVRLELAGRKQSCKTIHRFLRREHEAPAPHTRRLAFLNTIMPRHELIFWGEPFTTAHREASSNCRLARGLAELALQLANAVLSLQGVLQVDCAK